MRDNVEHAGPAHKNQSFHGRSPLDDLRILSEQTNEDGLVRRLRAEQLQFSTLVLQQVPYGNVPGEHGFEGQTVPFGILQPDITLAAVYRRDKVVDLVDVGKFHGASLPSWFSLRSSSSRSSKKVGPKAGLLLFVMVISIIFMLASAL